MQHTVVHTSQVVRECSSPLFQAKRSSYVKRQKQITKNRIVHTRNKVLFHKVRASDSLSEAGKQQPSSDANYPKVQSPEPVNDQIEQQGSSDQTQSASPLKDDPLALQELLDELKGQTFGQRGEPITIVALALLVLNMFPPFLVTGVLQGIGILAMMFGCGLLVYGLYSIGRNFSFLPAPRSKHKLVTSGAYGIVRHPQYGALVLLCLGLAALTCNETRLLLSLLLAASLDYKAKYEERLLQAAYKADYQNYQSTTPYMLVPAVY